MYPFRLRYRTHRESVDRVRLANMNKGAWQQVYLAGHPLLYIDSYPSIYLSLLGTFLDLCRASPLSDHSPEQSKSHRPRINISPLRLQSQLWGIRRVQAFESP